MRSLTPNLPQRARCAGLCALHDRATPALGPPTPQHITAWLWGFVGSSRKRIPTLPPFRLCPGWYTSLATSLCPLDPPGTDTLVDRVCIKTVHGKLHLQHNERLGLHMEGGHGDACTTSCRQARDASDEDPYRHTGCFSDDQGPAALGVNLFVRSPF